MPEKKPLVAQAGAIAFTFKKKTPMVLLVRAKTNPDHWIFPKGHLEKDETGKKAGIRELREEAGIKGIPVRHAGKLHHELNGKRYAVDYFLVRFASADRKGGEKGRDPCWCSIGRALSLLTFPNSRKLLRKMVPYIIKQPALPRP